MEAAATGEWGSGAASLLTGGAAVEGFTIPQLVVVFLACFFAGRLFPLRDALHFENLEGP